MRIARLTRLMSLLVAGIFGASCTKSSDEAPRLETAATASVPAQPVAAPETTAAATPVDSPQARPTRTAKPVGPLGGTAPAATSTAAAPTSPAPVATPTPSADSTPAAAPGQAKTLSYDAATKTVTFELIAGPFTFNGYRNGGATLVVPPQANVVINFVNKDGTPHSAIVISGEGAIPNSATDPAIPRAYTNKVLEGLPQEGGDVMRFPVPNSGTYRIFCGVPGHGLSGMWIWMKIDPAAKVPSFGPTKA